MNTRSTTKMIKHKVGCPYHTGNGNPASAPAPTSTNSTIPVDTNSIIPVPSEKVAAVESNIFCANCGLKKSQSIKFWSYKTKLRYTPFTVQEALVIMFNGFESEDRAKIKKTLMDTIGGGGNESQNGLAEGAELNEEEDSDEDDDELEMDKNKGPLDEPENVLCNFCYLALNRYGDALKNVISRKEDFLKLASTKSKLCEQFKKPEEVISSDKPVKLPSVYVTLKEALKHHHPRVSLQRTLGIFSRHEMKLLMESDILNADPLKSEDQYEDIENMRKKLEPFVKEKAPTTYAFLNGLCHGRLEAWKLTPVMIMMLSIAAMTRNQWLNRLQKIVGLTLYESGAQPKIFALLRDLGVSIARTTTIKILQKLARERRKSRECPETAWQKKMDAFLELNELDIDDEDDVQVQPEIIQESNEESEEDNLANNNPRKKRKKIFRNTNPKPKRTTSDSIKKEIQLLTLEPPPNPNTGSIGPTTAEADYYLDSTGNTESLSPRSSIINSPPHHNYQMPILWAEVENTGQDLEIDLSEFNCPPPTSEEVVVETSEFELEDLVSIPYVGGRLEIL